MSKFLKDMNSSESEEALINRLYTRMIDPLNNNGDVKDIEDIYRLAYLKMDHLLSRGMHETSSIRWSGASAFTAVIVVKDNIEELIHVANCGMILFCFYVFYGNYF
jgi:hypothetical protein